MVMQWVKIRITVPQVLQRHRFDPHLVQWVKKKNPALLQLWLGFNPWPRDFHMLWVEPLKTQTPPTIT